MNDPSTHWDNVFASKEPAETSWFQDDPTLSLALLDEWATRAGPSSISARAPLVWLSVFSMLAGATFRS